MTKKDFIKMLGDDAGISQKEAVRMTDVFLGCIESALTKSGSLSFVGWGSWKVSLRKEREGRNPQTGKALRIPAKNVVKFKAGSALENAVNK